MTPERIDTALTHFSQYIVRFPALHRLVMADVQTIQQVIGSHRGLDWQQGRDAAARLRRQASELGLHDLAQAFYECYEFFCLRLLSLS